MCAPPSGSAAARTNAPQLQRPVIDSMLQSILPKELIIWLKVNNFQEMTPSSLSTSGVPFKIKAPTRALDAKRASDFSVLCV